MSRKCVNNPDNFFYICGDVIFSKQRCSLTPTVKKAYRHYFEENIRQQDKTWAAYFCGNPCLRNWLNGKKNVISLRSTNAVARIDKSYI